MDLQPHDIHVWHARVAEHNARLLSPTERAFAERFRFAADRARFISGRALARCLVGRYSGVAPESVVLSFSEFGKPSPAGIRDLHFNVSHSHDVVVCAIARRPVGVDVERVEQIPDLCELASRFFSVDEFEALQRVEGAQKTRHFFTCWTRKEAYVKAIGEGLSCPLSDFTVSIDPLHPRLLHRRGDPGAPARWTLENLDAGSEYVGAVATVGTRGLIVERRWPLPDRTDQGERAMRKVVFTELTVFSGVLPLASGYMEACCRNDPLLTASFEFEKFRPVKTPFADLIGLLEDRRADVYAFSSYVWNTGMVRRLVEALLASRPEVHVVLGGPQVMHQASSICRRITRP